MQSTTHDTKPNITRDSLEHQAKSQLPHYMPQLDALRAIAVSLVIIEHWLPHNSVLEAINPGYIGVVFFFVLSGFLITNILLDNRLQAAKLSVKKITVLKKFVIRRALRIFPIYYITIFCCYILGLASIREKIVWYASYLSNYYVFFTQSWGGALTHLWTLAVEEQFYLFWPLVILFVPQKRLLFFIGFFIMIGPFFRAIMFLSQGPMLIDSKFILILTPSCFDAFGLGAFLAYQKQNFRQNFKLNHQLVKLFLFIAIAAFIATVLLYNNQAINIIFKGLLVAIMSFLIINRASSGFRHPLLKGFLENHTIVYIGKISYGIYLFHNFIPYLYALLVKYSKQYDIRNPLTDNYFFIEIENPINRFLMFLFVLLIMAIFSWHFVEKPINDLKKKFKYIAV